MQTLYTDQSYLDIQRQLNRRFTLLAAVLVVLLGLFFWAMITRIEWLAMVSACVAGCFAVFFTGLFCTPLVRYRRLIRSALSGRNHEKAMEFDRMEPDTSVVDGVACRSLIFLDLCRCLQCPNCQSFACITSIVLRRFCYALIECILSLWAQAVEGVLLSPVDLICIFIEYAILISHDSSQGD